MASQHCGEVGGGGCNKSVCKLKGVVLSNQYSMSTARGAHLTPPRWMSRAFSLIAMLLGLVREPREGSIRLKSLGCSRMPLNRSLRFT
jgi:hypothetical protein